MQKKVAKLERPLSELTKDWKHVPVVDIEAYVNRSAEVRRKEVAEGKIPGKVKRPMNSFMLYRKAYQNRTKDWCLQNNHQVVSQVCGDSWPLEAEAIKNQFSEWARVERVNHQKAHPGYKFSPTKAGQSKAAQKRLQSEAPVSEESDLDDYEWQAGARKHPKKKRASSRMESPVTYPSTKSAYHYGSEESSMEPNRHSFNRSSYQITNPGRPLPAPYSQAGLNFGEYYQQTIRNHPSMTGVSDIIIKKQQVPSSFLGLPGAGKGYNLMNPYQQYEEYPAYHHPEQGIDPSLMPPAGQVVYHDGSSYGELSNHGLYFGGSPNGDQHQWQPQSLENDPLMPFLDPELNQERSQIHDPHMHILKGSQEGWHVESLDAGGEFDKWMEEGG